MNDLQIFHYNGNKVRTIQKDGEPWWVLKDVCEVSDLSSPHKVFDRLDEDEKGRNQIPTLGGEQEMTVVNESGLYNVILRSDKPEAKPFRKWVTSEVLPSIRKNGGYISGQENMTDDELLANAVLVAQRKIAERDKVIRAQDKKIEEMNPKAIFADAVSTSHTSILIGDFAKLICQNGVQIGQKRLFEWLRNNGYLVKSGSSKNMPVQRYIEQGLFEVKESSIQNPDGSVRITRTTKISGKGQVYFVNKFLNKVR